MKTVSRLFYLKVLSGNIFDFTCYSIEIAFQVNRSYFYVYDGIKIKY